MSGISPPPPRPKLKLSVSSRQASFSEPNPPGSASTPMSTPKIRIKASQPPTPAIETPAPPSATTKAGRQTKPTSKLIESKKREKSDDDEDERLHLNQPSKRIKLQVKTPGGHPLPPQRSISSGLILKSRGRPPPRPHGDGYDSEASDREIDPTIEEQFILRMLPGEHCDYVRKCMEENKIGLSRSNGGADLSIKWLDEESRRAILQVKGQLFVAVMVELPTITEGMKTWDRKGFMKSADICHMLLVFERVSSEEEARKAPLPPMVQPGFKWPHGLTPPMHDAENQRFAKIIERSEIDFKESQVKKLLQTDQAALASRYEFVDDRRAQSDGEDDGEELQYSDEDEDADGDMDESGYFPADGYANGEMMDDDKDLEAELEAALFEEAEMNGHLEAVTPGTQLEGVTPGTMHSGTPAAAAQDDDEESVISEEDDDDDSDEDDNEEHTRIKGVKEDIARLKDQIASAEAESAQHAGNKILRNRVEQRIKNLRAELRIKIQSLGEEEEEEEEEE
ncbi:transcription initiation factor TFIID subunit 7 [Plectosphaerella plurivora]|uniref:Transcription initiation factor TFIID subunit 7 n=1 Tax=Plectosphaerella plurivora TaxID=936078 RepID=A0A9P8V4J4_9PEZI|nr:transcription initiation factor TFIID subunit 7 [Plectosphaerella plurivora]